MHPAEPAEETVPEGTDSTLLCCLGLKHGRDEGLAEQEGKRWVQERVSCIFLLVLHVRSCIHKFCVSMLPYKHPSFVCFSYLRDGNSVMSFCTKIDCPDSLTCAALLLRAGARPCDSKDVSGEGLLHRAVR